jgi:hypothetical protein
MSQSTLMWLVYDEQGLRDCMHHRATYCRSRVLCTLIDVFGTTGLVHGNHDPSPTLG